MMNYVERIMKRNVVNADKNRIVIPNVIYIAKQSIIGNMHFQGYKIKCQK